MLKIINNFIISIEINPEFNNKVEKLLDNYNIFEKDKKK